MSPRTRPRWLTRQLYPFEDRWMEIDGHTVHYVDEGRGPVLLLLHGNPTWSFLYRDIIRRLRDSFRCVAVDYPGFGLSTAGAGYGFTPREHSAVLEKLFLALDLRDVTPVVQDWGGPIGLGLAGRQSDRISALVIGNTWAWPADGDPRLTRILEALLDGADLLSQPLQAARALLHHPAGLLGQPGLVLQPGTPGGGPAGVAAALAVLAQQGADLGLEVATLGDQLLAVAGQRAQLAEVLGGDPDARQVADPFEVGQDAGVGEVGLVGRLLHAADEAGMGQVDGPAEAVGQLLGEVGGAGAGLQGGAADDAEAADGLVEGVGVVGDGAVAQDLAVGVEGAELDGVLGVVEADEEW
jgi:haloalkane dehalogenase